MLGAEGDRKILVDPPSRVSVPAKPYNIILLCIVLVLVSWFCPPQAEVASYLLLCAHYNLTGAPLHTALLWGGKVLTHADWASPG